MGYEQFPFLLKSFITMIQITSVQHACNKGTILRHYFCLTIDQLLKKKQIKKVILWRNMSCKNWLYFLVLKFLSITQTFLTAKSRQAKQQG